MNRALGAVLLAWLAMVTPADGDPVPPTVATFSIVARDPARGDLGVAVASKVLAVGAVVPFLKAEVGAIATQAWANTRFGPEGLRRLAAGATAADVLAALLAADARAASRQVALVDSRGRVAVHTGRDCHPWAGSRIGPHHSCQGNLLAGPAVVASMDAAYRAGSGDLAGRLMAALEAGQTAGGDRRGRQSAALRVVRKGGGYGGYDDKLVDLRVDDHRTPILELRRLLGVWRSRRLLIEAGRLADRGQTADALALVARIRALNPRLALAPYLGARIHARRGDGVAALASLRAAIAVDASLRGRARVDRRFDRWRSEPAWQVLLAPTAK